jgi:hypothetical protein
MSLEDRRAVENIEVTSCKDCGVDEILGCALDA